MKNFGYGFFIFTKDMGLLILNTEYLAFTLLNLTIIYIISIGWYGRKCGY